MPALPEKKAVGRFETEFVEARYGPGGDSAGVPQTPRVRFLTFFFLGGVKLTCACTSLGTATGATRGRCAGPDRRAALERMLSRIVAHPILAGAPELVAFLESDGASGAAGFSSSRSTDSARGNSGGIFTSLNPFSADGPFSKR